MVAGRDEHRPAEAGQLREDEARRLRPRALGLVKVAADRQRVGAAFEREVDDALERVGQRGAAARAAAHLGERRLEVHVGGVDDRRLVHPSHVCSTCTAAAAPPPNG